MSEYPHMCRDGHAEVGWRGEGELCPVCIVKAINNELLEALKVAQLWSVMQRSHMGEPFTHPQAILNIEADMALIAEAIRKAGLQS